MRILLPLPSSDFDPTEAGVSWSILHGAGHDVVFATPDGNRAVADQRMVEGRGLGILKWVLMADGIGRDAHERMIADPAFAAPLSYRQLENEDFSALVLAGGHAAGMKEYLESELLQRLVAEMMVADKPVAAICHGVVVAARSKYSSGRSVLYRRKTTALTKQLELAAWSLTRWWLGDYYRTYPITVEDEVTAALESADDFLCGPPALLRDRPDKLTRGFVVRDGNYLSARWPGDAHRFAHEFLALCIFPRLSANEHRAGSPLPYKILWQRRRGAVCGRGFFPEFAQGGPQAAAVCLQVNPGVG